jgi:hypothetical protein
VGFEEKELMTTATKSLKAKVTGGLLSFAVLLGALGFSPMEAGAVSVRTKLACLGDYRSHCKSYKMGSNELRQCMSSNGPKLSKKCINALVADGEISEAEVARRAASLR